jgi:Cu2+-exporting ATPase
MDTETEKQSQASSLVAKAFSQTGLTALALLALLVAAILNPALWVQLVIAIAAVVGSHYLAGRLAKSVSEQPHELQDQKSVKETQVDLAVKYWPVLSLGFALLAILISTGHGFDLSSALTVFSAGLLLTNSHTLAWVIPVGVSRSLKASKDLGVVIRSREAFETLAKLNLVLFTKGGVLTNSPSEVESIKLSTKSIFKDEKKVLTLAASVESLSNHVFAQAIVNSAKKSDLRITKPKDFREIPGFGVEGTVTGKHVVVGSAALLVQRNIRMEVQELIYADESTKSGLSIVCVVVDGTLEAIIRFTDVVKPTSVNAVYQIARERIRVGLLTGDSSGTAREKADRVNISEVYAELSPELKALFVAAQQDKGALVGVIANPETDSLVLDKADVSISLGSPVSDSIDINVPGNDPLKASEVIALSAQLRKKTNQGLGFAIGYGITGLLGYVAIVSPLQVATPPALTALLGSLSLLVVAMHAYSIGKLK